MNFSHFLLTQFNLRNFPKSSHAANDEWLNWTRNRITLFKTYCLPSILNQTEKNFSWLLYFDVATPAEFKPFIQELEGYGFIKICYCDGSEDFFRNYLNEIKHRIEPEKQWIMTTRLDNDDILHCNAIKTIQQNFIAKDKFLIALSSGYVMETDRKVLAHYFYPMSPFISLIESCSGNLVGIFARVHTQWPSLRLLILKEIYLEFFKKTERQSRFILKYPLWIQLVHGENVSNNFFRGLPVLKSKHLADFGINISTVKMKLGELLKFWNYVIWKRYFKCWMVKMILKK
jgi:Putative rhamnosyl transferase